MRVMDYQASHLAGKEAVFDVTVKEICEPKPVEIDDAFAQRFGLDSLDSLKEAIGEQMKGEYLTATRTRMKRQLLDILAEKHSFIENLNENVVPMTSEENTLSSASQEVTTIDMVSNGMGRMQMQSGLPDLI